MAHLDAIYLDTDSHSITQQCNTMFRNKMFECNQESGKDTSHSIDLDLVPDECLSFP